MTTIGRENTKQNCSSDLNENTEVSYWAPKNTPVCISYQEQHLLARKTALGTAWYPFFNKGPTPSPQKRRKPSIFRVYTGKWISNDIFTRKTIEIIKGTQNLSYFLKSCIFSCSSLCKSKWHKGRNTLESSFLPHCHSHSYALQEEQQDSSKRLTTSVHRWYRNHQSLTPAGLLLLFKFHSQW